MDFRKYILMGFILSVAASVATGPTVRAQQNPSGSRPASGGSIPVVLPKGKKLIMKDGSFQLAREYTVEGERVRYWSVERSDWEEIPASLVDWDATHKSDADQAAADAALKGKIRATQRQDRAKGIDIDSSLEIKPGLFLPDSAGFYGQQDNLIFNMKQSEAKAKFSAGREIERVMAGTPLIPEKATFSIPGTRAAQRFTTAEPEFYLRPADGREPRFRLIHAQVKDGKRVLENISINIAGQEKHKGNEVEFQAWTAARGVYRYTVDERLEPGEYAFVEMTDEGVSGYVWDFGIDGPRTKSGK
jgi:hypothetical protein